MGNSCCKNDNLSQEYCTVVKETKEEEKKREPNEPNSINNF